MAQGGIDAKIGVKKDATRKQTPADMAVIPVRPPDMIPAALSIKAVTGAQPKKVPMEMKVASVQ